MVGVAATVVADSRSLVLGDDVESRDDGLQRPVDPLGALERGVEVGHVGGVVLAVVDLHRARVDVRLEGIVCVGKIGQRVGHLALSLTGSGQGYAPARSLSRV